MLHKLRPQNGKKFLAALISCHKNICDMSAEDKVVLVTKEAIHEKQYNYNSLLTFVVDIITNWVKYPYHPKYNLNSSIKTINNIYEYVPW